MTSPHFLRISARAARSPRATTYFRTYLVRAPKKTAVQSVDMMVKMLNVVVGSGGMLEREKKFPANCDTRTATRRQPTGNLRYHICDAPCESQPENCDTISATRLESCKSEPEISNTTGTMLRVAQGRKEHRKILGSRKKEGAGLCTILCSLCLQS